MILAAGRGERMRPLTDHTPKPLLEVAGQPLIAYALRALATAGIHEVVINIAYLGHLIQAVLGDGSAYGVHIHYSVETQALETGGGIYQALSLLGNAPFMVLSADVWSDYPLQQLQLPSKLAGLAHLVMVDNPNYHPRGDFFLGNDDKLVNEGEPKLTFGNMGVYHPDLFSGCKPGFFRLVDVLRPAIARGQVTAEHYQGGWANIGTAEQLASLADCLRG